MKYSPLIKEIYRLSKKVSEFLEKEKEIEMNAIYQFDLKSIKLIDEGESNQSSEDDI